MVADAPTQQRDLPAVERKGRILVVDDSLAVRREVARTLFGSGGYEVVGESADGFAALKATVDVRPDVVLCDLNMPHCDGAQFLRMKKARTQLDEIAVIILTSDDDLTRKIFLLEQGADDFVAKPFHPRELLARVRIHFRLRLAQEQLRAANERLYDLACTDSLLGIFNRRHFDLSLEAEVARHVRYGSPFGLVLLDVDHFKQVNDRHGHATGDAVLTAIAATLKKHVRRADVVARYGGEELGVLLPNTGRVGALILAERLRVAVEEILHLDARGFAFQVTASLGVAVVDASEPALTARAMINRSDRALYAAKRGGRNRVVVGSPDGHGAQAEGSPHDARDEESRRVAR